MIENEVYTAAFITQAEIDAVFSKVSKKRTQIVLDTPIDEGLPSRYFMDRCIFNQVSASLRTTPNVYYMKNRESLPEDPRAAYMQIMGNVISERTNTLSLLVWLINNYKIKSVLDPIAKWGDRIFACALSNTKYLGFDTYLPAHEPYAAIIKSMNMSDKIEISSSTFAKTIIDDTFDMVFVSFNDEHPTDLCNIVIKSWNDLLEGYMCIHIPSKRDELHDIVLRIMKTQSGVLPIRMTNKVSSQLQPSGLSAFIGKNAVQVENAFIYMWKKTPFVKSDPPHISVTGKTFILGPESLIRRGLTDYVRSFATEVSYIVDGTDPLTEDIVSTINGTKIVLSIYVDSSFTAYIQRLYKLAGPNVKIVKYEKGKRPNEKDVINCIPHNLDDPIFEASLTMALKISLPRDQIGDLIEPVRVWIKTDNVVLVRCLLFLWEKSVLLISHSKRVSNIKSNILPQHSGRVILYHNADNSTSIDMKAKFGYEVDWILS